MAAARARARPLEPAEHAGLASPQVYVLEGECGKGLGKWLIETLMEHPELTNLRRFMLATRDAHGLYAPFGFTPLSGPEKFMEIARPGLYARQARLTPEGP